MEPIDRSVVARGAGRQSGREGEKGGAWGTFKTMKQFDTVMVATCH